MKKKKIVKKEPRQVMLLKKEVLELEEKLDSALYDKRYWEGKYEGVKENWEEKEKEYKYLSKMSLEEQQAKQSELFYLRELVSMLVVPADKLQELERLRQQQMRNGIPY